LPRRAFITGIAGQDGWYLSKLLLEKGYEVAGCDQPVVMQGPRGAELRALGVRLVEVDLLDRQRTRDAVQELDPDEIYNLAAQSFVPQSWEDPASTIRANTWPVIHLMDAVREARPGARFWQASTAEIFGRATTSPQDETTPVAPANPYAATKVLAHELVGLYRAHHGLFAVAGILYNHESPRRPPTFVTAKVCHAARAIRAGRQEELVLGDLDAARDWGYAGDYVDAMWRMLQQDAPEDLVIGTGVPHTVRDLCRAAFAAVGLDYRGYVRKDPAFLRPGDPTRLLANPAKAKAKLGWTATTSFEELVRMMVEAAPG
jgi:GDPmannose 4,6-dehydratase